MKYAPGKRREYLWHRKTKTQLKAAKAVGISKSTASRWDGEERRRAKGKAKPTSKAAQASAGSFAAALATVTRAADPLRVVPASLHPGLPIKLEVKGRIIVDVRTLAECELVQACLANLLVL